MKRILILVVAFILAACTSTGVVSKGDETYTIGKKFSRVFSGSPDDVRFDLYQEAAYFGVQNEKRSKQLSWKSRQTLVFLNRGTSFWSLGVDESPRCAVIVQI